MGSNICIVVADHARARIFLVEPDAASRQGARLIARAELASPDLRTLGASVTGRPRSETITNREAGPKHPMGAQRERHRLDLERRFALQIARRAARVAKGWNEGAVVLVAEAKLLGLVREPLRRALNPGVELKELAKNYAQLAAAELRDQLAANGILTARPRL